MTGVDITAAVQNVRATEEPAQRFHRANPFPASVLLKKKLSGANSDKELFHYEISLEGSGLTYEPGDSIGIYPSNTPELIERVLSRLNFRGDEPVMIHTGEMRPIAAALERSYNITRPSTRFVTALTAKRGAVAPTENAASELLNGDDILDLLLRYPRAAFEPQEFVSLLPKLQPRLYSIASSLRRHPGEVHLLVATVRYERGGRSRGGVCSTFLADRVSTATRISIFVHTARHFHLPEDRSVPIIMVGAGTGVAPYRAFMEEREATSAPGRAWLFFGERRRACDFSYQTEWEQFLARGVLTRLETAFSQDQARRIHVQDRLLERAAEVWAWVKEGAIIYVCGNAKHMAKEVKAAFEEIARREGGGSNDEAAAELERLCASKRYRQDVYS